MGVYTHLMDEIIIAFTVPTGKDRTKASAFVKAFYGQETSSHHGKYRYRRHGFLDEIQYHKLIRGVIIIQMKDEKRVINFLKEHFANLSQGRLNRRRRIAKKMMKCGTKNVKIFFRRLKSCA